MSFYNYGITEWKTFLEEASFRGLKINKAARHLKEAQGMSFDNDVVNLIKKSGSTITIDMQKVFKKQDRWSVSRLIHNIKMLFPDSKYAIKFNARIDKLAEALVYETNKQLSSMEKAPADAINHIFSFLPPLEINKVNSLSNRLNQSTTTHLITHQFNLTKDFIAMINQVAKDNNLPMSQPLTLSKNLSDIHNLTELQDFLLNLREDVVEALKKQDFIFSKASGKTAPQFFNHVFELVELHKRFDASDKLNNASLELSQLQNLCGEAARIGSVGEVKKFSARLISILEDPFENVIENYAYGRHFKLAEKHLKTVELTKGSIQHRSRARIAIELIKVGKLDEAIRMSNSITDKSCQDWVYNYLVQELARLGELDRAILFFNRMDDDDVKKSPAGVLAVYLCLNRRKNEAFDLAKKHCNGNDYVFQMISWVYLTTDIDKAIEAARLIRDEQRRKTALEKCG